MRSPAAERRRPTLLDGAAALLVAAAAALVPALPRLGAKMGADVLLFFVNYLLQKAFVY